MILAAALGLGLLIGLALGALGGGGSILAVPALVYVIGQDPRAAITSSLFIIGVSATIAALGHARRGRVRWGVGLAFGVTGIAAGLAGTVVNRRLDPDVTLLAFAGVLLAAAAGMLLSSRRPAGDRAEDRQAVGVVEGAPGATERPASSPATGPGGPAATARGRRPGPARAVATVLTGLVVGFMTGLFGVGGGFVIVPALTLALGLRMPQAVATSLVVIAINSAAALVARAGSAQFDWAVIVPMTLAVVAGSFAGRLATDRVSETALTRAFAVLLLAVAGWTATSSLISLLG